MANPIGPTGAAGPGDTAAWVGQVRVQLDRLSASLVDLDADPVTKLVEQGQFQGASRDPAEAAAAALARLWGLLPTMRAHLEQVEAELAKGRRADQARVRRLLHEPLMGADPVVVSPPTSGGGAGATPAGALTLTDAINRMIGDHHHAAGVIARIGAAWREGLGLVDEARLELPNLTGGVGAFPEAQAAATALQQAEQAAATDPLALEAMLGPLRTALDDALTARVALLARRDGLEGELNNAAELLARLDHTIRDGAVAYDEVRSKIAAAIGLLQPLDAISVLDAAPRGLGPWLERLRRTAATDWRAAINGLVAWRQLATATLAGADAVLAANRAPLARRNELRGLLGAMAAKAAAAGRAEDPALSALHRQARALLSVAPCDLVAAQDAVAAYQQALRPPAGVADAVAPRVSSSRKDAP
ncbi:MAG: hypothetical protein ACKV2O_17975 [Acidimicrobiales bacterium]